MWESNEVNSRVNDNCYRLKNMVEFSSIEVMFVKSFIVLLDALTHESIDIYLYIYYYVIISIECRSDG